MRDQILARVKQVLESITLANGYSIEPQLVQYGDGTPSEYDQPGIELSYMIPTRTLSISNKRWDWEGLLQVVATIYGDRTGVTELAVESAVLKALGQQQTLSEVMTWNWPNGMEYTTERSVAGKTVTLMAMNFPVRYSTEPWLA